MRIKFTKNKLVISGLVIAAVSLPLITTTSLATKTKNQQSHKIIFEGKMFSSYEEALNFYLANNTDSIHKELKYGDIGKATVNLNTGELNGDLLSTVGEGNTALAYKKSFGNYTRNYNDAALSFVNPIFSKIRYTYAGSKKTYMKREDAQTALDATKINEKMFYYKLDNNLFNWRTSPEYKNRGLNTQTKNDGITKLFNTQDIVFNPFNAKQINLLKVYLNKDENINKMQLDFEKRWETGSNNNKGFSIATYVKENNNKNSKYEQFDFKKKNTNNTITKKVNDEMANFTSVKHFKGQEVKSKKMDQKFVTNDKDWLNAISGYKDKSDLTLKKGNKEIYFEDINGNDMHVYKSGNVVAKIKGEIQSKDISKKIHISFGKFNYKDIDGGNFSEQINFVLSIGVEMPNSPYGKKIPIPNRSILKRNGLSEKFLKNLKKSQFEKNINFKIIKATVDELKGHWTYKLDTRGVDTVDHVFHLTDGKFLVDFDVETDFSVTNDSQKRMNLLNFLATSKKNSKKKYDTQQIIKYNNEPLFKITYKNGKRELENISNNKQFTNFDPNLYKKSISLNNQSEYNEQASFANAYFENEKVQKEIFDEKVQKENGIINYNKKGESYTPNKNVLYIGNGNNSNNDYSRQNHKNKSNELSIGIFWGEKFLFDKERYDSLIWNQALNLIDISNSKEKYNLSDSNMLQENSIAHSMSELKIQEQNEMPAISSIIVMFSTDGKELINFNSIIDNSKFDNFELMKRNMRQKNENKPKVDKNHIFIKKSNIWKLFSSEVHSIYLFDKNHLKYFNTYENLKKYLMEFIKTNSKVLI
ncbi:hypothetical protein MYMA111404_02670 [Mycoplasma marinum]|uniref:Uncharacterized protein n=1 Tax=Mycoplasma marinum TaxID=1937190 RepID=A0A4R0XME6_9MOLU|nr:hypothetical protein [Mycoplasma marinum]TCG10622.1 hypothetical protein C4B24_04365 [Mycoplasma marinum]